MKTLDYVIETSDLTKIYRSEGKEVIAVNHLNLKVESGTIFGLLGPNGAGKTTLIMMLTGLTLPTNGSARVLGYDIVKESLKIREKMGVMPEAFGFYDHLSAEQNLNYIATLNDIPKTERVKLIEEALATVGLLEVKDRKVGSFSRGMKQRLGVAQALLKDPEALIFDEPTAGLDPEGARAFKDLVLDLNRKGKTIMLSTHLLFEVGPLCKSLAIIKDGKAVIQGNVNELIEKLMVEEGYRIKVEGKGSVGSFASTLTVVKDIKEIKLDGETIFIKAISDIRTEISEIASKNKFIVSTIQLEEPSLEDLFMKYYKKEVDA